MTTTRTRSSRRSAPPAPASAARDERAPPHHLKIVQASLDDMKAQDVRVLDVRGHSDVTDFMVIASGTSDRHVKSIADRVVQQCKAAGVRPFGIEGEREGEWVLVDLPDVMVHVMLPRVREFYALEQLWEMAPKVAAAAVPGKAGGSAGKAGGAKTGAGARGGRARSAGAARAGAGAGAAHGAGGGRSGVGGRGGGARKGGAGSGGGTAGGPRRPRRPG